MARLEGKDDMEKLMKLNNKTYGEQAQWFLNAFWKKIYGSNEEGRKRVWAYAHTMIELDCQKGKNGSDLNEFDAHRFLEKHETTMTVKEMREMLKEIDIDFNKRVSLTEFLITKEKQDWKVLVNSVMGENTAEIEKAQALLTDAQTKLGVAINRHQESDKAEKEQIQAENELKRALQALEEEETNQRNLMTKLEADGSDMTKGVVTRNKAVNELAQLKAKDSLPLQRAKINQAAAVRKSEKATAKAAEARAEAEKTLTAAQTAFDAAEAFLDQACKTVGSAEGSMWWMQAELEEAKKYMPMSKGGKAKK